MSIEKIKYKTKTKGEVVKYRVRIKTKDLKFSKMYDDLETAQQVEDLSKKEKELLRLDNSLQKFGLIPKGYYADTNRLTIELSSDESLKLLLPIYFDEQLKKTSEEEKDIHNNKSTLYKMKALLDTSIKATQLSKKRITASYFNNLNPILKKAVMDSKNTTLGELSVFEISERDIMSYINARQDNNIKISTIKRELALLSGFFTRISLFGEKYENIQNPVSKCLKKTQKLKSTFIKRDRRLTIEERENLIAELKKAKNPDMLKIVFLALYTGMRRSEILSLKWGQLKHCYRQEDPRKSYIQIYKGKNQQPRKVKVFANIQPIIDNLKEENEDKKETDRVFNYTLDGFNTNIRRIIKRAGLVDYHFHDLRAELISSLFEKGIDSVVIADIMNIDNQAYFDRTHKRNFEENQAIASEVLTGQQIRTIAGHNDKNTQRVYVRLKDDILK